MNHPLDLLAVDRVLHAYIYLKVQLRTAIIPIIYTDLNKASNAIGVVKMKYI